MLKITQEARKGMSRCANADLSEEIDSIFFLSLTHYDFHKKIHIYLCSMCAAMKIIYFNVQLQSLYAACCTFILETINASLLYDCKVSRQSCFINGSFI